MGGKEVVRVGHLMHVVRQLIGKVSDDLDARLYCVLCALDMMKNEIDQMTTCKLRALVNAATMSLHQAAVVLRQLMAESHPRKYKPGP